MPLESTCCVPKKPSCLPHGSHNPRIITRPSHSTASRPRTQHDVRASSIYRRMVYQTHSYPSITTTSSLSLMASLPHQLFLAFLIFLASSSFQIIHARESRFLKQATRPEDTKEATPIPIPEETPAVKMEDPSTLTPLQSLSGSGYGLYGHGQERFTPATTTNYNNNNNYRYDNARPNTEFAGENYENKYNGGYNYANQFKYGYDGRSKSSNEEFSRGSYETRGYNNYVDPNKQLYGLSDTRFLDNGRYFYDVNAEKNRQYGRHATRGNYANGVYGNGNAYEYGNEDRRWYQNNQANQESQEEYVP